MIDESLIILVTLFILAMIELWRPARSYQILGRQRRQDLVWLLTNQYLLMGATTALSFYIGLFLSRLLDPIGLSFDALSWPWWSQLMVLMLILDLLSYGIHRSFHSFRPLWQIHKLHHSTTELTALSSFRHSWIEVAIFGAVQGSFSGLILVDSSARLWANMAVTLACLIQHSNIKGRLPEWLHTVIITPRNHYWHHARRTHRAHGQNFGLFLTVWDKIFATYYNPRNTRGPIGLSDHQYPGSMPMRLIYPFDILVKKIYFKLTSKS
jgi:sterol desaturase/sphingolipid hydroxylase (fatty acid hydroxylase superfamily)